MNIIVIVLLLLAAHFSLTALVPGQAGKAVFYWPFATDTVPMLGLFGAYPNPLTQLLSVTAGVAFLAAVLALLGWLIPASWWMPLVLVGVIASFALFLVYASPLAILPLLLNLLLLWGIFFQHWTANSLRGV